jgi:hypothetical protein
MAAMCVDYHNVCVAPAYAPVTEVSGPMYQVVDKDGHPVHVQLANAKRLGARISIFASDDIHTSKAKGLAVAPTRKGPSLYYAKTCSKTAPRCDYIWGWMANDGQVHPLYLSSFSIKGLSAAGLARAQRNIWLTNGSTEPKTRVALTALAEDAGAFQPVGCDVYPEPGCPDSPRAKLMREKETAGKGPVA